MKLGLMSRATAGALLAWSLASCGGGGGGDSSTATPGGGSSKVFDAVSISLLSPTSVTDVSFGGSSPHGAQLDIGYSGDPGALANQTVYVLVEVPDPLYESRPAFYADANEPVIHLNLGGNLQGVPEGRYTGTMRIYACLDPACATQLRGSPLSLPYDVDMKPGLKLSQETLNLETTFGTALPASEVIVALPFGGTDWTLVAGGTADVGVVRSGNKLVLTPSQFSQPGTYTTDVIVEASAPDPKFPATVLRFGKTLKVTYTVKPGNVPVIMSPAFASYQLALNDPGQRNDRIVFAFQQPPGNFALRGIRFDASPLAAAGHANMNQWLYASAPSIAEYFVIPCGTVPGAPNCLPAGTYQASLLYRSTSTGGLDTDLEFPVTMTIAP